MQVYIYVYIYPTKFPHKCALTIEHPLMKWTCQDFHFVAIIHFIFKARNNGMEEILIGDKMR